MYMATSLRNKSTFSRPHVDSSSEALSCQVSTSRPPAALRLRPLTLGPWPWCLASRPCRILGGSYLDCEIGEIPLSSSFTNLDAFLEVGVKQSSGKRRMRLSLGREQSDNNNIAYRRTDSST